jgi:hypothetical protein
MIEFALHTKCNIDRSHGAVVFDSGRFGFENRRTALDHKPAVAPHSLQEQAIDLQKWVPAVRQAERTLICASACQS